MTRQIFAFFNFQTVTDSSGEVFYALKLLLLYVMITAYHSHYGSPNEYMRICIIIIVYFFVGVAICQKTEKEENDFFYLFKKNFASIVTFTIISFLVNFMVTLVIRYYHD